MQIRDRGKPVERLAEHENSLLRGEEPFYMVFHASSNPMAITTIKEGQIIDLNEACARFAGFQRKELIGKTTIEHGIWSDSRQRAEAIRKIQEEEGPSNLEVEIGTKAGQILKALFSVNKIIINRESYLFCAMIDMAGDRNPAKELRESEDRFRLMVEQSLQGFAIMQNARFVFCNSRLAEISGYSIEELLSLSPEQMTAMIHTDDQAHIEKRRFDRMGGMAVPMRYEFRGIKRDGTEIWLEVFSNLIEYREKPAIQAAFMDITQHKRTAENLNKALDWQKAIFEGSRDAIMISDANYCFVDVNEAACQLTSYSKEELLNMGAWDLNKKVDPSVLDDLRDRILNGEDVLGETKIYEKNGREIDVEFGHRRVNISGKPYIHSIARDITNRKRLEAQFLQAQKMEAVGLLAGGIAHDLNNTLNVINGYSELVLEDLDHDHPLRQDLEQIQKAGKQSASLIAHLLAFSRKQILQPQILNLNQVAEEMSSMLLRLLGEDIQFETIMQPDLGLIYADPVQIQQIVMNIAINARDAMPNGGKLTVETANVDLDKNYVGRHQPVKEGPYVMLAISDNGIGMDATVQAHLFEPFFTTKEKGKGTGLGLSTVYGIVKQSNGFIWVYSELEKGTTFKIYLPRVEGGNIQAATDVKLEQGLCGSETVLVVEDKASMRALAARILRNRGYTVLEASDGKDALNVTQGHTGEIHLVITDVIMPGMSGKDLVSELKVARPNIKSLYVSGYTDNAIVHHGVLDSNVAFLQKPFSVDGLLRKVREVIDS